MNNQMDLIKKFVDREVLPVLQADGGDVEIISLKDEVLTVRVLGKCSSCPNAQSEVTLLMENALKDKVDGDIRVEVDITINEDLNELAKKILRKEVILS